MTRSFCPEIVGSFSTGAAANPTVAMMEASFAHEGLEWIYVNCEVPAGELAPAVSGAHAMGWRGFNCSIPHKRRVIELLDDLSDTARICDAVNCVVRTDGRWVGHNTDGVGFVESVRPVVQPEGGRVLVIGAGGAAHAIAIEIARAGAAGVEIIARDPAKAAALADLVDRTTAARGSAMAWSSPMSVPPGVDLVVDATPVGMEPNVDDMVEFDLESWSSDLVVADVVPNPARTRLLQTAEQVGVRTIDGRGMLVNQAAENIRLWTGVDPDRSVLRAALDAALG